MKAKSKKMVDFEAEHLRIYDDPNNWLEIPEFGVRPKQDGYAYEGFEFPIVLPFAESAQDVFLPKTLANITHMLFCARSFARQHVDSIFDLRRYGAHAYQIYLEKRKAGVTTPIDLTEFSTELATAFLYREVVFCLKLTLRGERLPNAFSRQDSLMNLSRVGSLLADWAVSGAITATRTLVAKDQEEAQKKIARQEMNAKNASAPRPRARKVDADEIKTEFDRLVLDGHTEREARGILRGREKWSPSSIYRYTKR